VTRARDLGVYLVTDRDLCLGRPIDKVVQAAVQGGVSCVQLREKSLPTRGFIELARSIKTILTSRGVSLIINDRVDVALAAGADGVHLGQDDMSYPDARRILGPGAMIGISVESLDQALRAESWDVDYLGVSPIFLTPTKPEAKTAWGLDGLRRLRTRSRHALIAIGGINQENAAQVLEAGADGLAVVSAICSASDPEAVSRRLREAVDRHRARKMGS
jgi:thiamine-phosphate pyrophosphorylase